MSSALEKRRAKWHIYDIVLPWSFVPCLAALHKARDQILAKHFQDWWHLWRSAPRVHLPTHGGLRVSIWGEDSLLIDTPVIRPKLYNSTDLTPICSEKNPEEGQHESSVKLLFFFFFKLHQFGGKAPPAACGGAHFRSGFQAQQARCQVSFPGHEMLLLWVNSKHQYLYDWGRPKINPTHLIL